MSIVIFLLLIILCIGLIYMVHKYFGKHEFYLLAIIYSILSVLLSFKLVNVFGFDINLNLIFSCGIICLLYYFNNKYGSDDSKKLIITIIVSTIVCDIMLLLNSFMIPAIYDENLVLFQNLVFDNIIIFVLYPIVLFITLHFLNYYFKKIKGIDNNRDFKILFVLACVLFVESLVFICFSYSVIINFYSSLFIALGNYLVKIIIMFTLYLCINKIIRVKKVNS